MIAQPGTAIDLEGTGRGRPRPHLKDGGPVYLLRDGKPTPQVLTPGARKAARAKRKSQRAARKRR